MQIPSDERMAILPPPSNKRPANERDRSDTRWCHGKDVDKPHYDSKNRSYELLNKSKGSVKHQMSRRFLLDMYDDWLNHGTEVLAAVRNEDPSTYLRIMASLVPKTLTIEDSTNGKSVNELRSELFVELGRALERGDNQLVDYIESIQRSKRQGPVIDVQAVSEAETVPCEREDAS